MDITLRMSDHALTARAAAAAGIVLLQNKNRTLPLLPQEDGAPLPVAVFGVKQLQTPAFDKTMTPWRSIGVLDGLAASETVRPDALLARKYRTWAVEHPEGSEMPLTNLDFGALRHDCAAAVVVIGRTPERYALQLTEEETAMLTRVTSVFDRTVLVLAAPGFIELNEAALSCSAIVFLGLAGQEAGGALADVLTAKVMPSGHLSFTWPENAEAFDEACAAVDQFTGYRYFDSFGTPVRYPFGYGLGYGKIEFGSVSAGLDGCDVTVSAELVNTGETHAASELMQVYVTRPGDDLTRPVSFLQAFSKSRLLAPGESQTIRLRFPITDLAVYRESAHAFVLDAGYYDIRIGTSSRACYLAGSIRLTRSAVVQAAEPLSLPSVPERRRPEGVCFQYPEELAEMPLKKRITGSLINLIPPLILIFGVLGSIFGGIATPTEAAGIGALFSLILAIFYKQFSWKMLYESLIDTAKTTAMVFIILFGAAAFTGVFMSLDGDQIIADWVLSMGIGKWGAFAIMMVIMFLLGMFIDWLGIVMIVFPIFLPIMDTFGFDRLWLVAVSATLLQTCFMTPPFGFALFYVKGILPPSIKIQEVYRGVIPFIIIICIVTALCAVFPPLVTWLPSMLAS